MKVLIIVIRSVHIELFLVRKDCSVPLLHPGHMMSSKTEPCSLAYIIKGCFFLIFSLFRCFALSITRLTMAKLASTQQLYLILAEDSRIWCDPDDHPSFCRYCRIQNPTFPVFTISGLVSNKIAHYILAPANIFRDLALT